MKTNNKPPRIALWILKQLIPDYDRNFIIEELIKDYNYFCENKSRYKSNLWFWMQLLKSLSPLFSDMLIRSSSMFKNYLKTGYRNFARQKLTSAINVTGLSLGLACSILIMLFIRDEKSFDRFHKNADKIYSVINQDNYFDYTYRYVPNGLGSTMEEFYEEIKYAVRLSSSRAVVRYNEKIFREQCSLVDPEFFQLFTFDLLTGDPNNVLHSENNVVLTESSAKKYFGEEDPIGKILEFQVGQWTKLFEVAGIVEDVPDNSTIKYDFLMNINNLASTRGQAALTSMTWPRCRTYILLKDGQNPEEIEGRFPAYVEQNFAEVEADRRNANSWNESGETIEFYLQNLKDIHLFSTGISGESKSSITKSYILASICILVLVIAGINFTNLAIGRAAGRVTEIGIRKILGADRKNLIRQFWAESIIVIIISSIFSMLLAFLILPLFNDLATKNLSFMDFVTFQNISIFAAVIIVLGFAAGSYPGLVLSNFQPVQIFKKKLNIGGKNLLTKTLVVLQFSISIFLVIVTLTMGKQINFIDQADLGYRKDNILVIETLEREFSEGERVIKHYRNVTENLNEVISVSGCVFSLGTNQGEGIWTYNGINKHFSFSHVYYGYFETMGIEFIEGREISKQLLDNLTEVVVNQEFVRQFDLENPVGMMISENTKIAGVVKNFNYGSLKDEIEPVIHWINSEGSLHTLLVRITDDDIGDTISKMESIWKEIQPNKPFVYTFLHENLDRFYAEDKKWNSIVLYSSVFSLIITCLGLVGITMVTFNRRIKEIGIKKVLGASVPNIINILSKEFLLLVIISNIIVWPVGYCTMNRWLQRFAFRTDIEMTTFIAAALLSMIVALVTISFQTLRAARANPVDSLRYE